MEQNNISANFIVFFRISIGLIIFIHFTSYWKDFDLLYTSKSIFPMELHTLYNFYEIITIEDIIGVFQPYFSYEISVYIFKISYIVLSIFIIIGLFSRISALLLIFLQISFIKYGSLFYYGVDFFTTISLFYIFLFPTSRYYSVQKYIFPNCFSFTDRQSLQICKFLIRTHLCIVYFFSGFDKLLGFNWWNGEALWKAINLPNFTKYIELGNYINTPIIYILIGWVIILIEILYPIFINIQKTRLIWLSLTISLHIGIVILFNLYFFASMMIIWNLTAYYITNNSKTITL